MKYLILLIPIVLTGCASLEWANTKFTMGIDTYCNSLSEAERSAIRSRVNSGDRLFQITCE